MIPYTLLEFDQIESTSSFLKENHSYFPHMTIIRARHQLKGRGQFERKWESNPNDNILFSVLLKDIKIEKMFQIKTWILTSLMHFINHQGIQVYFKEPNDLYIGEKKICGILIETQSSEERLNYAIIGVGLNINQVDFQDTKAISMRSYLRHTQDIDKLFKELLLIMIKEFEEIIDEH